VEKFEYWEMGR